MLAFRAAGLEAAEVVLAQQGRGRALHGLGVETAAGVVPAITPLKDVADRAVVDHVAVALAHDVPGRMKPLGDVGHFQHGDVVGQNGVQPPPQHLGRKRRVRLEDHDLPQGVNARVGPAAGHDPRLLAGDLRDGRFERPLHRRPIDLHLPAGIGRAVVGDCEFQRAHYCLINNSAICTAFVAAPLRRLSLTHQNARPFGQEMSSRMRPMNVSSRLVAVDRHRIDLLVQIVHHDQARRGGEQLAGLLDA